MSVLLTGSNNQIAMAAPGHPALAAPLPSTVPTTVATTSLTSIAGLAGWWDASAATGLLDPTGTPLTTFGAAVGSVADRSGSGAALSVWHEASAGTTPPMATGHLNGLLGGLGRNMVVPPTLPQSGQQLPLMDPDQGLISAAMALGAGTPWTVFLVWSRPNWRQSNTGPSTLLSIGGTAVLTVDNSAGTGRLILFPGTAQTILSTALTRRHTHALIVRNTPGVGVDVWLDATQVATAAANPLAASLSAALLFLHSGMGTGGAECWFHEAAVWGAALGAPGIAAVRSYQARWTLGPRKGIQIMVSGQSNAGNGLNDGAWHLLAQGVAWHLGALGYGVVGSYGSTPAATCIHGEGIYPLPALGFGGSFLTNPNDGSDPSTWVFGADGLAVQTWLDTNTAAADAADIAAILWPWSEDDCCRQYQRKSDLRGGRAALAVARARGAVAPGRDPAAGLVVGDPVRLRQQRSRHANAARGRGRHDRRCDAERNGGIAADRGQPAAQYWRGGLGV